MNHDKISIIEVNLNSLAVYSPIGLDADDINSHVFDVQFSAEYDAKDEFAMAMIEVQAGTVSAASEAEDEDEGTAAFTFSIIFQVDGMAKYLTKDDDGVMHASNELSENLAGISLSTVRGLMCGYLSKTALANFILPVVDPATLIGEDDEWE